MKKQLIIVGGANGSGKTTFAYQYRDEFNIEYLGADRIAADMSEKGIEKVEIKAGKEFFKRLAAYEEKGKSVIIESTLAGLGLKSHIGTFKDSGFLIHMIYLFLESTDVCKKRVAYRVKKGGHDVPRADIERRYRRSLKNFWNIYLSLSDSWQMFYTGMQRPIEVAIGEKKNTVVIDEEYFSIYKELICPKIKM